MMGILGYNLVATFRLVGRSPLIMLHSSMAIALDCREWLTWSDCLLLSQALLWDAFSKQQNQRTCAWLWRVFFHLTRPCGDMEGIFHCLAPMPCCGTSLLYQRNQKIENSAQLKDMPGFMQTDRWCNSPHQGGRHIEWIPTPARMTCPLQKDLGWTAGCTVVRGQQGINQHPRSGFLEPAVEHQVSEEWSLQVHRRRTTG